MRDKNQPRLTQSLVGMLDVFKTAFLIVLTYVCSPATAHGLEQDAIRSNPPSSETSFEVEEGTWMTVDVTPDGATIVFDLLGDIFSMPAQGGVAKRLLGGRALQQQPRVSPDGKQILFISDESGSDNVWISGIDGSFPRQLTTETTALLGRPSWRNDGQFFLASKYTRDGSADGVFLYSVGGGSGRQLLSGSIDGKRPEEAVYSNDGLAVFYSMENNYWNYDPAGFSIHKLDLKSGKKQKVLGGFGGATTAQPSPTGAKIAFVRRVKTKSVLFVYDIKTREQKPVFDDLDRDGQNNSYYLGGSYPAFGWFPDGRHIAIWGKGKLIKVDTQLGRVATIPFRAKSEHVIVDAVRAKNDLRTEDFTIHALSGIGISPSGDKSMFEALGRIWVANLDNSPPKRLTRSNAFEHDPIYAPDGKLIAFVTWDDEKGSSLVLASPEGRIRRILARSRGLIRHPSFSPDGKRVTYMIASGNNFMTGFQAQPGIYTVSANGGEPARIAETARHPMYSADGARIYFTRSNAAYTSCKLFSINTDGSSLREEYSGDYVSDIRLSPDGKWVAFKQWHKLYLSPAAKTGGVVRLDAASNAFPLFELSNSGATSISWIGPSLRIQWAEGNTLFSAIPQTVNEKPHITAYSVPFTHNADTPQGDTAFVNGRIITMRGDEIIENGTVTVSGNLITAVGRSEDIRIPEQAHIVDLNGKTLMPGFVDMHGHISWFNREPIPQQHPNHFAALAFGVTTNFDPSTLDVMSHMAAESQRAGVITAPRLITVGSGIQGQTLASFFDVIDSADDAQQIIERKEDLGTIIVKSYLQPARRQRQYLVESARQANILITAEAERLPYNNLSLVLDGHSIIEHNIPYANYYSDFINLFRNAKTAFTPTLVLTGGEIFGENYFYQSTRPWDDPKVRSFVRDTASDFSVLNFGEALPVYARGALTPHISEETWDIGFRSVARSLKKMNDAGVRINIGSHGQIQGLGFHWEMWLLSEGGMTNHDILKAATVNGATTLGLDHQIGKLEVGNLADLIVLDQNPLDDIRNTHSVSLTMVNGRLFDAHSMNEIGNHPRQRRKFFWESEEHNGIEWDPGWAGRDRTKLGATAHQ